MRQKLSIFLVAAIVVVLVVGGIWYWYVAMHKLGSAASSVATPSVASDARVVTQLSKLSFSPIVGAASATMVTASTYLQKFILSGVDSVTVQKLSYSSGGSGYLIRYTINQPFESVRMAMDTVVGSTKLSEHWTTLFAEIDATTLKEDVIVSLSQSAENASSTMVTVQSQAH